MAPRIVFARYTASLRAPGDKYPTQVRMNDPWWAAHPLVKAHPEVFSDQPSEILPRGWSPPVEQATAAPGEKRATQRSGDAS